MNHNDDLFYQIALTLVPSIGPIHARLLIEKYGDAQTIFKASREELEEIEGIGKTRAGNIVGFSDFTCVETEIEFIDKNSIRPLSFTDPAYPQRLLNCHDHPLLLFYKGEADLNASHIISIVGTRRATEYGKWVTEKLLYDLEGTEIIVISGLAYGIDALAHTSALKHQLTTVGVLGHGLDSIYPAQHKSLAKDILTKGGGLLTEFCSDAKPGKHTFPSRNRIVAGMCDAVIIAETPVKGGSMITAALASSYNKNVFAYPGRTTDVRSAGCNHLIQWNKAMLLTNTKDLIDTMEWEGLQAKQTLPQQEIAQLNENEQKLATLLQSKAPLHIDDLNANSGLSSSAIAAAILNMELQGVIRCLPGKLYKLT